MSNKNQQLVIPDRMQPGAISAYGDTGNRLFSLREEDEEDALNKSGRNAAAPMSLTAPVIEDLESQLPQLLNKLRELLKGT